MLAPLRGIVNVLDSEFAGARVEMVYEAIGFCRDRLLETFNPAYWIEAVIYLPRKMLAYVGLSPESLAARILQVIYWVLSAVWTLSYAAYNHQIGDLLRRSIKKFFA